MQCQNAAHGRTAPEKRRAARQRVLRGGVICIHQLGSTVQCTVRNLSETGACLLVTTPVGIPSEFTLVLDREKVPRHCRIVWRATKKIGVVFQ